MYYTCKLIYLFSFEFNILGKTLPAHCVCYLYGFSYTKLQVIKSYKFLFFFIYILYLGSNALYVRKTLAFVFPRSSCRKPSSTCTLKFRTFFKTR